MSILLTTHYIEEAENLCHRIGILQRGRLLVIGPTRELVKELTEREIVVRLREDFPKEIVSPFLLKYDRVEAVFRVPSAMGVGELLSEVGLDLGMIGDLTVREGSLEEAMKRVLKERRPNV